MLHNGTGFRIQIWYKKSHLGLDLISLAPGRFEWNFWKYIFNLDLVIDGWGLSLLKFTIKWMSLHILLMKSQPCDTECVNICRGRTGQSSVSEEPYAMYNGNGIINRSCAPNGPTWALYLVRRLCPQRTVWGLSSWWPPMALLCWYPSFISIHYNSFEDWVPAGAGTRSSNELHWFEREEATVFGCCCFNSFWMSKDQAYLTWSIACLMVIWWHKEPRHQQKRYWLSMSGLFRACARKIHRKSDQRISKFATGESFKFQAPTFDSGCFPSIWYGWRSNVTTYFTTMTSHERHCISNHRQSGFLFRLI